MDGSRELEDLEIHRLWKSNLPLLATYGFKLTCKVSQARSCLKIGLVTLVAALVY